MKKKFQIQLLLCILASLLMSAHGYAQTQANTETATGSLPNLPEADAILYMNSRRIINEALPRILPAAEYAKIQSELEKIKKEVGIDINGFESAVVALRFNTPVTAMPDYVLVTRGTFNADALLSLARIGLKGKLREEKYGSKSINIFKLSEVMGTTGTAAPLPVGTSEMAVTALDGNTLALGTIPYVKATIDAETGQKRVNPELMALAMRDTGSLISLAIAIPPGLFSSLIPSGMQGNEEITKIISGIEGFSLSAGMNATDFPVSAAVRMMDAEQARSLSGLLEMGIRMASGQVTDKNTQAVLNTLKITADGNAVRMEVAIPQEVIATLVRESNKPKPEAKSQTKAQAKPESKAKAAPARKPARTKKP
jgi:hypothetical protein